MASETKTTGVKYDAGKTRLEILPFEALEEIAKVMELGAVKYGSHNWLKGMQWSKLAGAALRHLFAWITSEDNDPETGLSHLSHAGCCVLFLITYEKRGIGVDNRYKQKE